MKIAPVLLLLTMLQGSSIHTGMPLYPPVAIESDYYLFQKESEKDRYFFFPTHIVLENEVPELFPIDNGLGELVFKFHMPFAAIETQVRHLYENAEPLLPQGNISAGLFSYYDFLANDKVEVTQVGEYIYLTFLVHLERYNEVLEKSSTQNQALEGEIYFDHFFIQSFFVASQTLNKDRKSIDSIYENNDYSRFYLESAIQNVFYRKHIYGYSDTLIMEKDAEELNQLTYPLTVMVNRNLVVNKKIVLRFEIRLKSFQQREGK